MARLFPFRALRPTPASAPSVAAVPYDVVNVDEARDLARGKPLSFLHVSRAEIDLSAGTAPYADQVYTRAAENFRRLREAAPLVVEDAPSLYVYRLRMGDHEQTGVAACYALDEYERDLIKKHERTRRDKEDDRTRHLLTLDAQTGPVFLTYQASSAVDRVVARTTAQPPLFDFTATDRVHHTVWLVSAPDVPDLIEAFAAIPALYIADGHHRAASAARARQQRRGVEGQAGEWDTFLAVAFPDREMQILPYNRVVKDLAGATPAQLVEAVRRVHTVREGGSAPTQRGDVGMYLDGRWFTVTLAPPDRVLAPAQRLDVSQLQDTVLAPLLSIGDPRTDTRIDFVGGGRGIGALSALVDSGKAAVAFAMYPVSIADLMAISDAGGIMPPKSTWFEPKLRDGLLSHVF